jgi:cysteine synthase
MEEAIVPAIYDPSQIDITIMVETDIAYEMTRQIVKQEGIFVGPWLTSPKANSVGGWLMPSINRKIGRPKVVTRQRIKMIVR